MDLVAQGDAVLLANDAPEAFGEFYSRHVAALTSYFGRRLPAGEQVFDAVAETFARALERREQYDPDRGPAIGWLFGIACNLVADAHRHRRIAADARKRLGLSVIHLDEDQLARIDAARRVDLVELLGELTPPQREAVMRRVLADQSYPQIAAEIQCSEQVARQHVSRGLLRLRNRLREAP